MDPLDPDNRFTQAPGYPADSFQGLPSENGFVHTSSASPWESDPHGYNQQYDTAALLYSGDGQQYSDGMRSAPPQQGSSRGYTMQPLTYFQLEELPSPSFLSHDLHYPAHAPPQQPIPQWASTHAQQIPSGLPQSYHQNEPQVFHSRYTPSVDAAHIIPPPPPPPEDPLRPFSFSNPPRPRPRTATERSLPNTTTLPSSAASRDAEGGIWQAYYPTEPKRRRLSDYTSFEESPSVPGYSPNEPSIYSPLVDVTEQMRLSPSTSSWDPLPDHSHQQQHTSYYPQPSGFHDQGGGELGVREQLRRNSLPTNALPPPINSSPERPVGRPRRGLAQSAASGASHQQTPPSPILATSHSANSDDINYIVRRALDHRQGFDLSLSILPKPKRRVATRNTLDSSDEEKVDKRKGGKVAMSHDASCGQCGVVLAKLVFRGTKAEVNQQFRMEYRCISCRPLPPRTGDSDNGSDHAFEENATYADTLSGAVDRAAGLSEMAELKAPVPARVRTTLLAGLKRRSEDDVLICDICTRELGSGNILLRSTGAPPEFGVEVSCLSCDVLYQRCSDCGGSGGTRLGVGKYRSKELFPDGRKTCQLSHLRLGSRENMNFDIWAVSDLPVAELEEFIVLCRDLFILNVITGLAVPEVLEPVTNLARNFMECQKFALDTWTLVEPMLREGLTRDRGIKRYIALRWSSPPPRKKRAGRKAKEQEVDSAEQPMNLIRKGKVLAGFVIGELDLMEGILFLAITTPSTTGEVYHSTTILMQTFLRRLQADLIQFNTRRPRSAPFPPVKHAWLVMFYAKETRLYKDLLNRRGYTPVKEYCESLSVDQKHFAPHRPIFLPIPFQKGWHVLCRAIVDDDDWSNKGTTAGTAGGSNKGKARSSRAHLES